MCHAFQPRCEGQPQKCLNHETLFRFIKKSTGVTAKRAILLTFKERIVLSWLRQFFLMFSKGSRGGSLECQHHFPFYVRYFYPLLPFERVLLSTASPPRYRGTCWTAIRLSHRPEPSGRVVREEVDGLDSAGRHGRRFVLRHTHRPQRRP